MFNRRKSAATFGNYIGKATGEKNVACKSLQKSTPASLNRVKDLKETSKIVIQTRWHS
jgi:hypothetical protein